MIKLVFTIGREVISFEIENKIISYVDRKFPKLMQVIPMANDFERAVIMSRNRIPKELIELVKDSNKGKNKEEYDNAKDDEELVLIIKKDAISKGCVFQKRIDI